jgi:hypothetical protein
MLLHILLCPVLYQIDRLILHPKPGLNRALMNNQRLFLFPILKAPT